MRETLLAVAASLALALAPLVLGDRTLLARAPEAVVEAFVRALDAGRPAAAVKLLRDERAASPETLAHAYEGLQQRVHGVRSLEGARVWSGLRYADAAVRLETGHGDVWLTFRLEWTRGEWRITDPSPLVDHSEARAHQGNPQAGRRKPMLGVIARLDAR